MKIKFINHACFILESRNTKIMFDPWFFGNIFDNGWSLIKEDLDISHYDFDYVWVSHEHPDHFRPNMFNEKYIPKSKSIILQERADDPKLKNWFTQKGYNVIEIPTKGSCKIEDITLKGSLNYDFDSWVYLESEGQSVLNLNDCISFKNNKDIHAIKNKVGNIDVLLEQFSFANWSGNKGDIETPKKARKIILDSLTNISKILKPKYVVPFASFCWFSHEENVHLNKNAISIREVLPRQKKIIMKPNDSWDINSTWGKNKKNISYWENEVSLLKNKELTKTNPYSKEDLEKEFLYMKAKIHSKNDMKIFRESIKNWEPALIYITDLDICCSYDILDSLKYIEYSKKDCDIYLSSEALFNTMKNAWGFGTLMVNGRFEANYQSFDKFVTQTRLFYMNNIGKFFPENIKMENIIDSPSLVRKIIN